MSAGDWNDWVGRSETLTDSIDTGRAQALQATLDDAAGPLTPGDALPPLWHWAYFWSLAPTAGLGPDGHAARGGFLPPIDLPRRMWAGSRVEFPKPLPVGAAVTRKSTIKSVTEKSGRSGRLAFVTVEHVVSDGKGPAIVEEHDIVYREAGEKGAPLPAGEAPPQGGAWRREVEPSPVLRAICLDDDTAHASIRFGVGRFTTEADIDYAVERVAQEVERLRALSPTWAMRRRAAS